MKYLHTFDIQFSVGSDSDDFNDVTRDELRDAAIRRIMGIRNGEWHDACGHVSSDEDRSVEKSPWGAEEHDHYTMAEWRDDVVAQNTRLGYKEWVNHQIELEDNKILIIPNVNFRDLEKQRRGLMEVIERIRTGKKVTKSWMPCLEGIENMLNGWSDSRYYKEVVK